MTALPGKPAANATPDNGTGMDKLLASSPGARLQRAREAARLSVTEAADALHLSPGVVKALEADDFRSLPNATFVKGYMRSYARLLGIPGEELVRTYESITGTNKPQPVTPIEAPRTGARFAGPIRLSVLCILVLAAVWYFWPAASEEEPAQPGLAQSSGPEVVVIEADEAPQDWSGADLEQAAIGSAEPSPHDLPGDTGVDSQWVDAEPVVTATPVTPGSAPAVVPEPFESVPAESVPGASAAAASAPAELPPTARALPSGAESVATAAPGTYDPAGADGHVTMNFTGDCWVEVRDGAGALIYSNLKRNGESLTVKGTPPLEAKLGNGNVVSLSYNDQPVSFHIPPHNVVRVRLGD
ncbi:MAG: RodZ family helix-turn-helix domain-containing protein [Pseudomonadota bacterium]|nr:RodZ family helix-turn-helix domain-containing protein [Pseudomonadota bacterium]